MRDPTARLGPIARGLLGTVLGGGILVVAVLFHDEAAQAVAAIPIEVWVGLIVAGLVYGVAYVYRERIIRLLWEPRWTWLLDLDHDDNRQGVRFWKLSRAAVADLEITEGEALREWPSRTATVLECRGADPHEGTAQAYYKEIPSDGELADRRDLRELVRSLDKDARMGQLVLAKLPSIVRVLDRRRSYQRADVVDEHLVPTMDDDEGMLDAVSEVLPAEVLPDALTDDAADEAEIDDELGAIAETLGEDVDVEDVRNLKQNGSPDGPAAVTDGGLDGE
jgi:hypothetical protein